MQLGTLKKINDLRSIWLYEDRDFTNWLAEPKNLELLGKEIGLNIQLEKTEAGAGSFFVDILAMEPETGNKIIIENQLEKTDHDHLGKLITYASGYEASNIIWIVKEFRNEHKAAIDWLNEHTDENVNFFGVVIELWQIGESSIAPKFDVVSQPNSWSKTIKVSGAKKTELSEVGVKQINFLEGLRSHAQVNNCTLNLGNPQPRSPAYYAISIGITGVWIAVKLNTTKRVIKIDLYFADKELYYKIKHSMEEEVKNCLPDAVWDDMKRYKGAIVGVEKANFNIDQSEEHTDYYEWILTNAEKIYNKFFDEVNKVR